MKGFDLESLKQVFADKRVHIAIAQIKKLGLAADRSVLRVQVSVFPEQREIIARMSWSAVGEEAGVFMFPNVGDLVLVCMADGDEEDAFVFSRLTSKIDKIPLHAADGDLVAKALTGKKTWITSDTRINLSAGDTEPTENLVLGQVFKTMQSEFLEAVSLHTHIGNLGYNTAPPDNASVYTDLKADPIDNEGVLSDLAFTEKGG